MNWAFKIAAKVLLSRVPLSYRAFRRLGMFRHGRMNKPAYAEAVFFEHVERVGGPDALEGKVCLELGPGDSLASAILARALGARGIYLVDVGNFAETDVSVYHAIIEDLREKGYPVADLVGIADIPDLLARANATYLTDGVSSLASIPDKSVDVIWSQAVLEHVRRHQVPEVLRHMRRIITPSGVMSHRIDYKDHLGGSLNNLRFPEKLWESEFMARSGFYTNRIRNAKFMRLFEEAGFELTEIQPGRWHALPLPRDKMVAPYRNLADDDLLTKHVNAVAVPAFHE
jgi:SAM-dependent methyltransferase